MNRRYILTLLLFLLAFLETKATHIVGGEFQMRPKRGYTYEFILRIYFDELSADPGLLEADPEITAAIYEKGTNEFVQNIRLKRISQDFINYKYNECFDFNKNIVRTRLLYYTTAQMEDQGNIFLDPKKFNHPAGYYVVWQRCCRNGNVKNITNPLDVGQTFYMEFPPVVDVNGKRILNTTPLFENITGDFPCAKQPFTFYFGGLDPDKDSLVYKMVTPLKGGDGVGSTVTPPPGPYDPVNFNFGYDESNEIPGNPSLYIDKTGFLHVTASDTGLFVFAVDVDEYRKGVKLGSIHREFQFRVVSCPAVVPGPQISLKSQSGIYYTSTDTIHVSVDKDTCFIIQVTDPSTGTPYFKPQRLTLIPGSSTLPSNLFTYAKDFTVSPSVPVWNDNLCFSACRKLDIKKDTVFRLQVIVRDYQCPQAKTDTLNSIIKYSPAKNAKPDIALLPATLSYNLIVGDRVDLDAIGTDPDVNNILNLSAAGMGFNLGDYGMRFTAASKLSPDTGHFSWTVPCNALAKGQLKVVFNVRDNSCNLSDIDTISVVFNVKDKETSLSEIRPTNLFTPNGDDYNQYYYIPNLPPDNCTYFFKGISIYNRWGAKVYEDSKREFRWSAEGVPDGMYYYSIDLNAKKIKGWLEIVR